MSVASAGTRKPISGKSRQGLQMNQLHASINARNANMSGESISEDKLLGLLSVKVKSNASKTEIIGFIDGVLHVRVKSVADKGKANAELVKFLRKVTGKRVEIVKGLRSRDKIVRIG